MGTKESRQAACRTAAAPLLAGLLGQAGTYLQSQLHPVTQRITRLGRDLLSWLAGNWDARPSSIAKAILLLMLSMLALVLSVTSFSLGQSIAAKIEEVIRNTGHSMRGPYSRKELEDLPEPVKRFFSYTLRDGQPAIRFCSLRQTGLFRLRASPGMRANDGWKKVKAHQYFSVTEPGYVWVATIQLAPLFWVRGWDSYLQGKGNMLWKLLSAITLVDFGGPEIDQAGLSRYLSESVFFPTALLPSQRLTWEPHGVDSARATLKHGSHKVSAVFHFNEVGQVTSLTSADRPRQLDDGSSTEDHWTGYYRDYRESDGIVTPRTMEAVWNLMSGDFAYALLHITENKRWDCLEAKQYLLAA